MTGGGRYDALGTPREAGDTALGQTLASVLLDGLPAVLQANYVMGGMGREDGRWRIARLPELPPGYVRPGLWTAVRDARRAGVWRPEFHAAWHYDPALRRERALEPGAPRAATERGILLFPGSEHAWELGPWRPLEVLEQELALSLGDFRRCFGRAAVSVIAPDYTWTGRIEAMWERAGLTVIQAKREQRNPERPAGPLGRALKVLGRRWSKLAHPGRVYLERNCRFEPVQDPDPAAVTARCLDEIRAAWAAGRPAIVETHRVNFVHTDPQVVAGGRGQLERLLAAAAAADPVFLVDAEVAALQRHGVSARALPGGGAVLRNGTRSRRVVALPPEASGREPSLVLVPAGGSVVLRAGSTQRGAF